MHRTLCGVRPVQHQARLVHSFSVEFEWPTLELDGEYLYSSTLSMRGLLPICSAKKHLVVQKRNKSLERIENWVIFWVNPSLVSSKSLNVHPPLSGVLFGLSKSSLLVTLGDLHHLDSSVVITGTKITRCSCGWLVSSLRAVVGDSPWQSVKELAYREHLVFAQTKGEQDPCAGAPTRTSGEWRLSDTSAKHRRALSSTTPLLSSIYFVFLYS